MPLRMIKISTSGRSGQRKSSNTACDPASPSAPAHDCSEPGAPADSRPTLVDLVSPTSAGRPKKQSLFERRRGGLHLKVDTCNCKPDTNLVIETAEGTDEEPCSDCQSVKTPKTHFQPLTPLSTPEGFQIAAAEEAICSNAFRIVPSQASQGFSQFPVVMELQNGSLNSRTPLFLVHPDSGFGVAYHGLPDLGRPVFAISNTYLANGLAFRSINDAARIYLEQIRRIAPTGPYLLGGWSIGGNIAREMAAILSHEWAQEQADAGILDEADSANKRVYCLMLDSYNHSWAGFRHDSRTAVDSLAAFATHTHIHKGRGLSNVRCQKRLLSLLTQSPCCSPVATSFADQGFGSFLQGFADAAGSHIRNQQQLSAELLRDEDPTRFAHRREICPGHQALKNGPTISTSCYAHVCLLKAGKSEIGVHTSLLDLAQHHRRCLSRANGWTDANLAPGVNNFQVRRGGSPCPSIHTIPFTHDNMFCAAGCDQVGRWICDCLAALGV
ncbi:hypothetical protein OC846_003068 [Tilletia horrida]|uniref:Thioesterase domain-containing protein n=1 Tax=Tilletia horrida TaxID=155126 RepID=A0AAN6GSK4_9BASI|nr:hypothetical protein OC845_002817 [Tilletia horrida]KAK0551984.1 hypothetical protein OC846_003068 [Tilletia horrida]KAK0566171.1 hypothetical protein OC861_003392 [Tilletia horrida]